MIKVAKERRGTAYGYVRVSSSEQSEHGLGLEVQKDQVKKYCDDHDITLIKVFEDPGLSGADANRPGLQSLITQAKNDGTKLILIAHSSRLARDSMLSEIIYRDLRKHGISLISVSQPNYYEDDGDFQRKLIRTILDAFDEYEKSLIAWRLKNGRAKRVSLGGWHGGWIYGYRPTKNGELVIEPKESEIVKKIFQCKKNKHMNLCQIAKLLNAEKVPTKKEGSKWYPATIKKILKNKIYTGSLSYRGNVYHGNHEPIIIYGREK